MQDEKWHTLAVDDCVTVLDSSTEGIRPSDVTKRQQKYGFNKLAEPEKTSAFMRFISQYNDPLNYLLI
ncbi:MAG: cation-transporting P-type ATPase, partial [Candidatus Poseidonia sp.]|uniref:cation-transporting P-type ATPase n=1 Tax=Poseidonia sp. TaxID=2666344 RepID=UPI0030BBC744|nr:cation-transporting P-type ATPase [Poseidonia sp.]